jgi:hypothetical protein
VLRPSLTEAPSLRRSYPASSVLRTSPPPHTARPGSRELPVDRYHDHRWGFPCCVWSPMRTCHRHYPGRFNGARSLVCLHCQRPSPCNSKVGSCNCFFEACSAFTHVTACTLAESPSDPFHRKLRQLRCLRCRFDCYRVERTSSRAGVAPAVVQRLSRRTVTPTSSPRRKRSGAILPTCASWPTSIEQRQSGTSSSGMIRPGPSGQRGASWQC